LLPDTKLVAIFFEYLFVCLEENESDRMEELLLLVSLQLKK